MKFYNEEIPLKEKIENLPLLPLLPLDSWVLILSFLDIKQINYLRRLSKPLQKDIDSILNEATKKYSNACLKLKEKLSNDNFDNLEKISLLLSARLFGPILKYHDRQFPIWEFIAAILSATCCHPKYYPTSQIPRWLNEKFITAIENEIPNQTEKNHYDNFALNRYIFFQENTRKTEDYTNWLVSLDKKAIEFAAHMRYLKEEEERKALREAQEALNRQRESNSRSYGPSTISGGGMGSLSM